MCSNNNYSYMTGHVLENKIISEGIFKLSVEGKYDGAPGQFYMIKGWEDGPLLARPISIHYIDSDKIEFLYQTVGHGTKLLSSLKAGSIIKLLGPLGNGFNLDTIHGRTAIVSGGMGIAPMRYVISSLLDKSNSGIELFCGYRSELFGLSDIPADIKINTATEDGSSGHKGYVTDILDPSKYDIVLCCGPEIMMKKVIEMCKVSNTPVYVSEERKMACGIGACLGCTLKTINGNKRSCKDGPVFNGYDLIL